MAQVGRPSFLTDETLHKIKERVIAGDSNAEIARTLGIPYGTFENWIWRNYEGFADVMKTYEHEHLLSLAKQNLNQVLKISPFDTKKDGTQRLNALTLKVKSEAAQFVTETLGRTDFHKKTESDMNVKTDFIIADDDDESNATPQSETPVVSGATLAVAQADTPAVAGEPIQDNSVRPQGSENDVRSE